MCDTIANDEWTPEAICDGCGEMYIHCSCDDLTPMPRGTDFHDDD
jgi:hypothetical protein